MSTITKTVTGKVTHVGRVGHTVWGNPMLTVELELEAIDGTPVEPTTPTMFRISNDASIAYAINNPEFADESHTYRLTRAGRISGYVRTL